MEKELLSRLPTMVTLEGSFTTNEVFINGQKLPLAPSLRVVNHSPTGFNWGYCGSGPAQMALAILLKYLPKEVASRYYQKFKFGFIAGLPRTDFIKTINLRQIMQDILSEKEEA